MQTKSQPKYRLTAKTAYIHFPKCVNSNLVSSKFEIWRLLMLLAYLWHWALHRCCFILQIDSALKDIDKVIGQLMNGLKQMKLHRCVNIILIGDHGTTFRNPCLWFLWWYNFICRSIKNILYIFPSSGMEEAHCDRTEFLSSYMSNTEDIILIPGSLGRIRARNPNNSKC